MAAGKFSSLVRNSRRRSDRRKFSLPPRSPNPELPHWNGYLCAAIRKVLNRQMSTGMSTRTIARDVAHRTQCIRRTYQTSVHKPPPPDRNDGIIPSFSQPKYQTSVRAPPPPNRNDGSPFLLLAISSADCFCSRNIISVACSGKVPLLCRSKTENGFRVFA